MSKPDLLTNIKFRRLLKATGLPRPLLIGHLEMLWTTAHVSKPVFLDADDVELAADWDGEPGQFAANLLKYGFLDETDDGLAIHDYWDHAPEYVKRRERRRRKKKAMSTADSAACEANAPASVVCRERSLRARPVSYHDGPLTESPPAGRSPALQKTAKPTVQECILTADRPLTDTPSSKSPPANQTSVPVRDTSVPVCEVSKRQPIATPSPDNTVPASDCSLEDALAKLDKSSPWYPHFRDMLTRVHQRLFSDSIPVRAPPSSDIAT